MRAPGELALIAIAASYGTAHPDEGLRTLRILEALRNHDSALIEVGAI